MFDSKDIEDFMKGFDAVNQGLKKTGAVLVGGTIDLGLLVRIAHVNPHTRSVLLPIIVAAKKKMMPPKKGKAPPFVKKEEKNEKKKEEKSSKKDDKKTSKPKPKARKSSVNIEAEDINWS
jgi:hypothetical protein